MELTTASAVINFAEKLEDNSAKFYEDLAQRYAESSEFFLSFVTENKKNKTMIKRTYNEVISDALEACFLFEGLNAGDYLIETTLIEGKNYADSLKVAMNVEEKIQGFYLKTAEQSKPFLADVSRVFERIAKKRNERKLKLKSLYGRSMPYKKNDNNFVGENVPRVRGIFPRRQPK